MAERQGFEPWVGVNPQRFSRPPRSTTPAPLRWCLDRNGGGLAQGARRARRKNAGQGRVALRKATKAHTRAEMASAGNSIKQVLSAADAAAKSGDTGRAIALYRQILTKVPKHSKAKKALVRLEKQGGSAGQMTQADANALVQILNTGNFEAAQNAAKQLSQRFPNEPFVFNILGYASGMIGDQKAAIAAYKWAIKLNPNFVEALSNYGSYLVQIEKLDDAVAVLAKAVAKKPDYAEAHHNLGVAYVAHNEMEKARHHYDRAIEIAPSYANALNSRGTLRSSTQDASGAISDFRAALAIIPNDASILAKLGGLLVSAGQTEEGFALMEKSIGLNPTDTATHLVLAVSLNETGDRMGALAALKALIEVDPSHAEAYRLMVDLLDKDELPAFVQIMEAMFKNEPAEEMDRVHLGFALGYYYEKMGETEQSFTYLNAVNTLYRAQMPALPETNDAKFKRITNTFSDGCFDHLSDVNSSDAPIFIVGLMRSGTSLVEQIIATHSMVFGAGELTEFTEFSEPIYGAGRKCKLADAQAFSEKYLDCLTHNSDGAPHCVDKMPANFFNIGLIKTIFPNAKIINLVRDPRDNCFSIYKNFFDTFAHQYAYDQVELATFANNYKRMMNMWDVMFPGAVYHIKYEALVADQEGESRKLLEYLGLPWEDGVLDFHKTKRLVRTASINQVRQKVYTSSVKSWQNYAPYLGTLFEGLDKELWRDALVD